MKIIFFAGTPKHNVDDLSMNDITGTGALYNYFLRKEFQKMGIETDFCDAGPGASPDARFNSIVVPRGDHILSVAQRGFNVRCRPTNSLLSNVRKAIKGKITSICDHATVNPIEDIIFHALPYPEKLTKNIFVSVPISHEMLLPEKDPSMLRILIDHGYYGKVMASTDFSEKISRECLDFQKNYTKKPVLIRRFSGPTGCETVTEENCNCGPYVRNTSMPYPKACEEYRKCDIFIVTHPESLGLSVFESAASGAYIICPSGHIKSNVLNQVRCTTYKDTVPFEDAIRHIDIQKSMDRLKNYTWKNLANKIVKGLES